MNRSVKLSRWADLRVRTAALFAPRYGRHGAPDAIVAAHEIEHGGPWRAGERAVEHAGADDAYIEELHALVEEVKAEQAGQREPLPLTGELTDAERQAVIAAIQSETTEVPIVDPLILLERDTQRWFDDAFAGVVEQYDDEFAMVLAQLVDDEDTQSALLRLARSQRDENAQTIELMAVSA